MSKKYLALLRGVNVSGKNLIKMNEFRTYLQNEKFKNVKTYIQSGNIVFDLDGADNETIAATISQLIKNKYGFDVPVVVVGADELNSIIKKNPFVDEASNEPNKVMVSFLTGIPKDELVKNFDNLEFKTEKFKIFQKWIFLYCMNGIGKAKINNNYLESKLKVGATTRNWKTILKLHEMMEEA